MHGRPYHKWCVAAAAAGLARLFSVKDHSEILKAKRAAFLASNVMQNFVADKIQNIIGKNEKVKHRELSGEQQAVSVDPDWPAVQHWSREQLHAW